MSRSLTSGAWRSVIALLVFAGGSVSVATSVTAGAAGADLSITKTDGVSSVVAGGSVIYTITASNAGPNNAVGATVADTFPASLTATWTCVGAGGGTCTAAGSGNINDTVNLPAGGIGHLHGVGLALGGGDGHADEHRHRRRPRRRSPIRPPATTRRPTRTRSPGQPISRSPRPTVSARVIAGGSVTYTITASNAGPSNATGATIADTFPAPLTATWTCVGAGGGTCTASGSGNINDSVNLPAGGSVTYTASASLSAAATGTLTNTATVSAPGGVTDPTPGNNSATDSDTIGQQADLSITKTDGVSSVVAGGLVTYTITASNAGPERRHRGDRR